MKNADEFTIGGLKPGAQILKIMVIMFEPYGILFLCRQSYL